MTDLVRQLENTSEKTAQVKILQEIRVLLKHWTAACQNGSFSVF